MITVFDIGRVMLLHTVYIIPITQISVTLKETTLSEVKCSLKSSAILHIKNIQLFRLFRFIISTNSLP